MKKSSLVKLTVVLGISLVLVLGLNSLVYAADDNSIQWNTPVVTDNTTTDTTPTPTTIPTITPTVTESAGTNTVVPESTNTNTNTNTNYTVNNTSNESIPYTGIEDTNTLFVLAVLIGLGVAVYSLKKVNDYNNI